MLCADSANSIAIGKVLCASDVVRHISFTGHRGGPILMAPKRTTVKKISLELGGNAPSSWFDDADIDSAVEGCALPASTAMPDRPYVQQPHLCATNRV